MKFKAKLFKLGNSVAVYIPKRVYTELELGKEYEVEVYTGEEKKGQEVYTPKVSVERKPYEWCPKHSVSKYTCGCK